jgi:hypothetical protein
LPITTLPSNTRGAPVMERSAFWPSSKVLTLHFGRPVLASSAISRPSRVAT